jgi:HD-like signal output (HDOD) protein
MDGEPGLVVPQTILDSLNRTLGSLRMLPEVAQQALTAASAPDCDLQEIGRIIQRDIRLTTFILRIANSSAFGSPKAIASLPKAILFIGARRVQSLIIASSLDAIAAHVPPAVRQAQGSLWLHGFMTGLLATRLNTLFGLGFDGEQFTAGLMHDFGRTLILLVDPLNAPHVDPLNFDEPHNIEDRERAMLGVSHAELGAWFAEVNELPDPLIAAIQWHHQPRHAGEWRRLAALIAVADHAANSLQQVPPQQPYVHESNRGVAILEEEGVPLATSKFAKNIEPMLDVALQEAIGLTSL